MSAEIQPFEFDRAQVRTLTIDGALWFVLRDVMDVLGLTNSTEAVRGLDDDEVTTTELVLDDRSRTYYLISEPGLFALLGRSRKPIARQFDRWVRHEVLPEIFSTGSYNAPALSDDEIVSRALQITSARVQALEAKVAADAPKVAYVDEFLTTDDVVLFRVAANQLGISERDLRDQMLAAGWIWKRSIGRRWSQSQQRHVDEYEYLPAAAHRDKFRSIPQHRAPRHHNDQLRTTLYIRAAALPAIRRRLNLDQLAVTA